MSTRRGLWSKAALMATSGILAVGAAGCTGGTEDSGEGGDQGGSTTQSDAGGDEGMNDASDAGGESDAGGAGGDGAASAGDYGPETDLRDDAPPVQAKDAIATAKDQVGDGILHAVELDYDESDSAWQWDVKILDGTTDHKIVIDAVSGEVVGDESDTTDDEEKAIDLDDPMTYDEALDAATAERDGELRGWKLEYDDGMIQYQFDIADGGDEEEVTVNAETGDVTLD